MLYARFEKPSPSTASARPSANAQLAARYATPAQRQMLRDLVGQMRAAGSDHARRVASDAAIHAVIAEASGNGDSSSAIAERVMRTCIGFDPNSSISADELILRR